MSQAGERISESQSGRANDVLFSVRNKSLPYEYRLWVTFSYTNAEGNMSHDQYATVFGIVRELFGLDMIPHFKEEAGTLYLLKTKNAHYSYQKDFYFGDTIIVRMGVTDVTGASFTLYAEYVSAATRHVHATASQRIVFTNMEGRPRRLPTQLRDLLKSVSQNE